MRGTTEGTEGIVQAVVKLLGGIAEMCWLLILVLVCYMIWAAGAVVKL